MRVIVGISSLCFALAVLPAGADTSAGVYADRTHTVEAGVYHPLSADASSPAPEVSMQFSTTEVLVGEPDEESSESFGCVDMLIGTVLDSGCGPLDVTPDGVMNVTRVSGDIASTAYDYVADPFSLTERGPSVIHVDLTFIASGTPSIGTNDPVLVGVCGLPPDTRGVFAIAATSLQRDAAASGILASAEAGAVAPGTLSPTMIEAAFTAGGACIE